MTCVWGQATIAVQVYLAEQEKTPALAKGAGKKRRVSQVLQQSTSHSKLGSDPQGEMKDRTKNQNHKLKGCLVKLGTYSSVVLHPGINELSGPIGSLEETWV